MTSPPVSFHHPVAFWFGCALLVAGAFSHLPMFLMGQHTHWQMVGMPMDRWMLAGMAMIPIGLAFSTFGLMPRFAGTTHSGGGAAPHFHVAGGVPFSSTGSGSWYW